MNCKNCEGYDTAFGCGIFKCNNILSKRLDAYEEAEKQGLLIRLPCKLGDTVYHIVSHTVDVTGYRMEWELETTVKPTAFRIWMMDAIGKTVFLTREEAEAKLKELKGEAQDV